MNSSLVKSTFLFLIVILFFSSCKKEDFTEQDAYNQALTLAKQNAANKDSATINIQIASYPSNELVAGASIQVFQNKKITYQTGPDGTASFKILRANAEFTVKATDYGSASFMYSYSTVQNQSIIFLNLKLPKVKPNDFFTVSGTANAEFNLNSVDRYSPVPAGVKVTSTLLSDLSTVVNVFNDPAISNVSVFNLPTFSAEALTDASGKYTLKIPAITGANFYYRLDFSDFSANQNLAINRFLDASEPLSKYNVFGDFKTVQVATNFTTQRIDQYSSNPNSRIPENVPLFKAEVLENPTSGPKPLYVGTVISNPYESANSNLSIGRLFQFLKVSRNDGPYGATLVTLKITDLRDGTTTTTQFDNTYNFNNYGSGGFLPPTLTSTYPYYYNYISSPLQIFNIGLNTNNSIATPNGYLNVNSNYTAANSYVILGQTYQRTPNSLSILSYGTNSSLLLDNLSQKYFIGITGAGGQSTTLDVSYGTGIKSRPVE